jgi:hypothetical protein
MKIFIFVVLTAALAYIVYRLIAYYDTTQGTLWERLLSTAGHSATILWQYWAVFMAWILSSLGDIATILGHPDIQTWIKSVLSPEYVGAFVALVAFVTIVARLRTLGT